MFLKKLESILKPNETVKCVITKNDNGTLTVSLIPSLVDVPKELNALQPLQASGTVEELSDHMFEDYLVLMETVPKYKSNIEAVKASGEKIVEETKEKSKPKIRKPASKEVVDNTIVEDKHEEAIEIEEEKVIKPEQIALF